MKKLAKILSLCLAFAMLICLSACGTQPTQSSAPESANTESSVAPEAIELDFPKNSINVIIPKGAGGPTDSMGRVLLQYAEQLNSDVHFTTENVTGANGVTGMTKGALAKADGYTITAVVVELGIMQNIPSYNCAVTTNDFRMVSIFSGNPVLICARAGEYADIYDFIDKLDSNVRVGNNGIYAIGDLSFKAAAEGWGKDFTAVPYADGDSAAIAALIADNSEIDALCCCPSSALTGQIEAGVIDVLCILGDNTVPSAPNAPAISSLKDGYAVPLNIAAWCGFGVPAETPDDVYNYLVDLFTEATNNADFQNDLVEMGTIPAAINGADAQKFMEDDAARYALQLADVE